MPPTHLDPANGQPTMEHGSHGGGSSESSPHPTRAVWIRAAVVIALIAVVWMISWSITHSPSDELIR